MRVTGLRVKEVADEIFGQCIENGIGAMDKVVILARAKCPTLKSPPRPGGWGSGWVRFTPRKGKDKGKLVEFYTEKRWMGRQIGDLRSTIRRVDKVDKPGKMRVYAGNFKFYWAFMVERGTSRTRKQPFLQPAFRSVMGNIEYIIKNGA